MLELKNMIDVNTKISSMLDMLCEA